MCQDQSVGYLQSVGYNVIRYPSQKYKPLQILVRVPNRDRVVELIGPIADIISSGPSAPQPQEFDGSDISGKESNKFELSFGLGILGDLLKTLGAGKLELSAAFKNSKEIQFVYENVKLDSLMTTTAANYLKACKPNVASELFDKIDEEGEAFCIIETLKSDKFSVKSFDESGVSAKIDVDLLQGALAFTPGIEMTGTNELVTFSGGSSKQLVFGFKAIPVWVALDSAGMPYFKLKYSSVPTSDVLESAELSLDLSILSKDLLFVKLDNGLDRPMREMAFLSASSQKMSDEAAKGLTESISKDLHQDPDALETALSTANVETEALRPWRAAKCLEVLRDQINAKFPRRDKSSDGTIGDLSHQGRDSDHNPWVVDGNFGVVTALDITHDPASGCNAGAIVQALWGSRDPRIKYIIWNKRIANSSAIGASPAWTWRTYSGPSPHTEHFHLSVKSEKSSYDSPKSWVIS